MQQVCIMCREVNSRERGAAPAPQLQCAFPCLVGSYLQRHPWQISVLPRSKRPQRLTFRAACSTWLSLAPSLPYAMLYRTVSLKSTRSWGTAPRRLLRLARRRSLMSWPPTRTVPPCAS